MNGTLPSWLTFERYNNGFGLFEGHNPDENNVEWHWNFLFDVTAYVNSWKVLLCICKLKLRRLSFSVRAHPIFLQVKDGKVTFANKFVQSEYFKATVENYPAFRTFAGERSRACALIARCMTFPSAPAGTSPPPTMAQKVKAMTLLLADNYNVNIVQVWGHPTHPIGSARRRSPICAKRGNLGD